jgi:adenylate cyclase
MVAAMKDMNRERADAGSEPIPVSIGIHYGDVVLGDVGSERRLEFAVLGDVVNVASRLEALTRQVGAKVVVSDGLVDSLRRETDNGADDLLEGFRQGERQPLRGREEPIGVWMYA